LVPKLRSAMIALLHLRENSSALISECSAAPAGQAIARQIGFDDDINKLDDPQSIQGGEESLTSPPSAGKFSGRTRHVPLVCCSSEKLSSPRNSMTAGAAGKATKYGSRKS